MALNELQRLQKRARDKDSRLRVKGAVEKEIRAVSPLQPWNVVKGMTSAQQTEYMLKLRNYTNRKTDFIVYESGEITSKDVERNTLAAIRRFNARAARERARINAIGGTDALKIERRLWQTGRVNFKTGELNAGRGSALGALTEIAGEYQRPKSARWAKIREKSMVRMSVRPYEMVRNQAKRNMLKQLRDIGASKLAKRVAKLSNDAFDVLSVRTDIWEHLGYVYIPSEDRGSAHFEVGPDDYMAQLGMIDDLVSGAEKIKSKQPAVWERKKRTHGKK